MKRHRSILVTVGAFMAASALTFSTPAGSEPASVAAPTVPGCPDAEGYTTGASIDELQPLYVGVWIRCSDTSVLSEVLADEVGIELADDGTWHRVFRAPDGTMLRGQGIDHEGTWALRSAPTTEPVTTQGVQLDLVSLYGFTVITRATLTTTPEVLVLDDGMAQHQGGYVKATGLLSAPAPASRPFPTCPAAVGPRTFDTSTDAIPVLAGSWIRCSAESPFPPRWNEGEIGIELTAGGTWYALLLDDRGMPTRSLSPVQSGTYEIFVNVSGFQITFAATDHTTVPMHALYLTQPAFVYVIGAVRAGYVPWDGNPLPIVPPSL